MIDDELMHHLHVTVDILWPISVIQTIRRGVKLTCMVGSAERPNNVTCRAVLIVGCCEGGPTSSKNGTGMITPRPIVKLYDQYRSTDLRPGTIYDPAVAHYRSLVEEAGPINNKQDSDALTWVQPHKSSQV